MKLRELVALFLVIPLPIVAQSAGQTIRSRTQPRGQTQSPAPTRKVRNLTAREIAALIFPSSVSIYVLSEDGDAYSGSGFIVGPGVVATCYHVVEGARRIVVTPMNEENNRYVASLISNDGDRDTALLRVSGLKKNPLKISHESDFYIGEQVYTLGNPRGFEGTFSNGIISNFMRINDTYYMQFTAPISPGSSGGPVVNSVGEVVGMVNMQVKEGQNLNFAIMGIHVAMLIEGRRDLPDGHYIDNDFGPKPSRKP